MRQILKTKSKASTVALILMLIIATPLITCLTTVNAQDEYTTYAYLAISPDPIGVGQTLMVTFWLNSPPPTAAGPAGDRWEGYEIEVTDPDGNVETLGPFTSDPTSSQWTQYVPDAVGTWYFQFSFPGQWINTTTYERWYKPSTSPKVELTVQQEPIEDWPAAEPPTDYWERPIYGENREWWSMSGNWLAGGSFVHGVRYYNASGNFNPYTEAPDSAHIVWTKELTFGGLVGGEYGSIGYYAGESYERKFAAQVIINGKLYYNTRLGSSSWHGTACVDLRTGEELWFQNGTTITFGQLLNFESPNQHGVIPYLWGITSGGWGQPSTYHMYDAVTGEWILDIANVTSGTMVFGPHGEILLYSLSGMTNTLSMWNSSRVEGFVGTAGYTVWAWRPPLGATLNGTTGIQWTVSVPDVPGSQSIAKILPDVIYARSTVQTAPTTIYCDMAYSLKEGEEGRQLWVQNRSYGQVALNNGIMMNGVFTSFQKETMKWTGFDIYTGQEMWVTEPYTSAWGMYQPYADWISGYGKLYAVNYDGYVHAYDLETGTNLWNYYGGSTGFETPYGYHVFKDDAMTVADGKVFAVNNEHSPNQPLYRGAKLHCIDAETGTGLWNISFWGLAPAIADGYAVTLNFLDNRLYCFGKGKTATTISASPKTVADGDIVLIEGTVTDQSPAQPGTPCVSKESMSAWMEYLHMQKALPMETTGVPVKLEAFGADGSYIDIGTVRGDTGGFRYEWTPPGEGLYSILATFLGDESYWSSWASTGLSVGPTPPEEPTPAVQEDIDRSIDNITPLLYGTIVAVVVTICLVLYTLWTVRKLRK